MAPHTDTPALPRMRRSLQITEDLKTMISNGELTAGRRIPTEAEICARYGVSRTTVREALQSLRSTGILEVTPGRGSYVRRPDPLPMMRELATVLSASGATNAEAACLLEQMTRHMLTDVAKSNAASRQELYQYVVSRRATAGENAAFETRWYLTLSILSGQPLAGNLMQLLLDITQRQREIAYTMAPYAEHMVQAQMRITAAICEGDFASAERLVRTLFVDPEQLNVVTLPLEL